MLILASATVSSVRTSFEASTRNSTRDFGTGSPPKTAIEECLVEVEDDEILAWRESALHTRTRSNYLGLAEYRIGLHIRSHIDQAVVKLV